MSREHHEHHYHNVTEANEKHFDSQGLDLLAGEEAKTIGRQAANAFLNATQFNKDSTTVLDFACGIGTVASDYYSCLTNCIYRQYLSQLGASLQDY